MDKILALIIMEKKLLLIFGFVLILCSCNKQNINDYNYKSQGLNRNVKSIKVTTYEAKNKFGEITKCDFEEEYLMEFNSSGNITSITFYDENGELEDVIKYKYDNNNQLIEYSEYDYNGELNFGYELEYENDLLKKQTIKLPYNNKTQTTVFEHNGEYTLEERFFINDILTSTSEYTRYDDNGKEWVTYDKEGAYESKGICEFNRAKQITLQIVYDKNGEIKSKITNEYNNAGCITKHCINDNICQIERNDKNLPVSIIGGELYLSSNFFITYENDDLYIIEYEYDKKGNWIKQFVYKGDNKEPYTISERIINY